MEDIIVKDSIRKIKRDFNEALGTDILRYISELLTNADDSYRRLEAKGVQIEDSKKTILIKLEKDKRNKFDTNPGYSITVTDNAEGMSMNDLERIFGTYGANNAGGVEANTRGIFGQGASDVLRSASIEKKSAQVYSIKDGEISGMTYYITDDLVPKIKPKEMSLRGNRLETFKLNHGFSEGNGTSITFGVPNKVNFTGRIIKDLPNLICKYPSFRYILNQRNRKVIYEYQGKSEVLSSSAYQFECMDFLHNEKFSFIFDSKKIECEINLYINKNKADDGTDIIVRDENFAVFDCTMFDFKNVGAAKSISGELVVNGLYRICYDYLNAENPVAIVNDNRTGFNVKNKFYIELNKAVSPIIQKVIDSNIEVEKTANLMNDKKFNDALRKLNKYIDTHIEDNIGSGNLKGYTPPIDGIKFVRPSISITLNRTYTLKLLINSDLVSSSEKIFVQCADESVEFSPAVIQYDESEINDGLVIKNVTIKGIEVNSTPAILLAVVNNKVTTAQISVIEDEIHYPENGFEFYPNDVTSVYNKQHNLKLYFDKNVLPIGTNIAFDTGSLESAKEVEIKENYIIADNIGCIPISLNGGELGSRYVVKGKTTEIETEAKIMLIDESKNETPGHGLISGFELDSSQGQLHQAYYHPFTHKIVVNTANTINEMIMGDMKTKSNDDLKFTKEQRKYLCDLISTQAANLLVKKKEIKNGEINTDDMGEAIEKVQNIVQQHKNKIFHMIYESMFSNL